MNKTEIVDELHEVAEILERLSRDKRRAFKSSGHEKWHGMAIAYEQAAIKVRRLAGAAITKKPVGAITPAQSE